MVSEQASVYLQCPVSHMPAAYVPRLVYACCGSLSLGCVMRVFVRVHLRKQPSRTPVCHIEDGKRLFCSHLTLCFNGDGEDKHDQLCQWRRRRRRRRLRW